MLRILSLLLISLGMLECLVAQDFRATILGQVKDASGASVPQATVKATRKDTNSAKETVSNENGFYAGVGLGYAITEKGSVSLSAAYGSLNGLLSSANESGSSEIESKAPGYSVNLVWNHAATATTSYRVGIKYTAYTYEGKELRENGVVTPIPRAFDYYDRVTTFYIGIVESF